MTSSRRGWLIAAMLLGCAVSLSSPPAAGPLGLSVRNGAKVSRPNETVTVPWGRLPAAIRNLHASQLRLTDEQGRAIPLQVDDLDADGTPDELVFQADFAPLQMRSFTLAPGTSDTTAVGPARTDAADWKRMNGVLVSLVDDSNAGDARIRKAYRFDGVGWESDVVAYRLYLDPRNAVDILGKRKPGLYWNYIGTSGVDYQLDADWGTDILHVGDALGIGGIAFWTGDSLQEPVSLGRQRTRILARGPVRAVVRVEYTGWKVGRSSANVVSIFTIAAGDRVSEQRVSVEGNIPYPVIATGIVRHDSTDVQWNPRQGWLYTSGKQSRYDDGLMMAINIHPRDLQKKTRNAENELLLLTPHKREPLRILLSSYWQGETGKMWTAQEIKDFLDRTALRLLQPLNIQITEAGAGSRHAKKP